MAEAFAALVTLVWEGKHRVVSPALFRSTLCRHAPQFSGYQQHDAQVGVVEGGSASVPARGFVRCCSPLQPTPDLPSSLCTRHRCRAPHQEFLTSLLDMLHEDLNQGSHLSNSSSPSEIPRALSSSEKVCEVKLGELSWSKARVIGTQSRSSLLLLLLLFPTPHPTPPQTPTPLLPECL